MSMILGRIIDTQNFEAQCENCLHPVALIPLTELTSMLAWLTDNEQMIMCFECDGVEADCVPEVFADCYFALNTHKNGPQDIWIPGKVGQKLCLSSSP